jgi:hypothetical protein
LYTSASRYGRVHLRTSFAKKAWLCGFVNPGEPL